MWQYLETTILPEYIKNVCDQIQIWAAGCACGEEACTLSILWRNISTEQGVPLHTSTQFKYETEEIAMKETNNGWLQEAYIKAYRFAAERHKGQLVPGTEWSYLAHLSMVSMEIMAALNHETDMDGNWAVQVAILHDTIEDTDTTYEELLSEFGRHVADGVLALTKDKKIEKQHQMSDSLRRIKLQHKEIWMVKLADRITNLQPPPSYWTIEKRKKYLDQAKLILNELTLCSAFLSSRLNEKIQAYQSYI